jgi:adenosine deaminase
MHAPPPHFGDAESDVAPLYREHECAGDDDGSDHAKQCDLRYDGVEAARDAYRSGLPQDLLELYYTGMSVLRERQDYFDLAFNYLKKVAGQAVTYAGIFFDPQGHTERG